MTELVTRSMWFLAVVTTSTIAVADEPAEPAPEPPQVTPTPVAPAPAKPDTGTTARAVVEKPLAPVVNSLTVPFAPWNPARAYVELEMYSQARMTSREGQDLSELRLDRGELGGRLALGRQAMAELRFEAIRSAVEGGSLGIDGDSTVFRLRTAQLSGMHATGKLRIDGAIGFVPDPWVTSLDADSTARPLSRMGSERLLGWPNNDLSALGRVQLGPARATITVGNGEGTQFPERNTGKTTTAVVEVVPIAREQLRVTLAGVVRDGSIGVASIRDRRYGGGVTMVSQHVRAATEIILAQGIGDRGEAEGLLVSGWADARVVGPVFVAARGSTLGFADDGGRISTFGGGVAYEAWRERNAFGDRARGRFRIWLAVDRATSSGGAMPVPGADAGNATQFMLIASAIAPFTLE
jgi:hypothetical protein